MSNFGSRVSALVETIVVSITRLSFQIYIYTYFMLCILNFYFSSLIYAFFINIYEKSIIVRLLKKRKKKQVEENRR